MRMLDAARAALTASMVTVATAAQAAGADPAAASSGMSTGQIMTSVLSLLGVGALVWAMVKLTK